MTAADADAVLATQKDNENILFPFYDAAMSSRTTLRSRSGLKRCDIKAASFCFRREPGTRHRTRQGPNLQHSKSQS